MATQMMTYARPSRGLSVTYERRSHRSVPSYSVAALWWDAEAIAWPGRQDRGKWKERAMAWFGVGRAKPQRAQRFGPPIRQALRASHQHGGA